MTAPLQLPLPWSPRREWGRCQSCSTSRSYCSASCLLARQHPPCSGQGLLVSCLVPQRCPAAEPKGWGRPAARPHTLGIAGHCWALQLPLPTQPLYQVLLPRPVAPMAERPFWDAQEPPGVALLYKHRVTPAPLYTQPQQAVCGKKLTASAGKCWEAWLRSAQHPVHQRQPEQNQSDDTDLFLKGQSNLKHNVMARGSVNLGRCD